MLVAILISITNVFSQELTDKIPNDPKVIVGTLDNGLVYYIRANSIPENRAELWLAVNAGSVLETEEQRGLAHFNEHMAFNGSKHFTKNDLIKRLEEIGMKFGEDLNAYTAFDETVYQITVPTDKKEYTDLGLLILNDVASELTFADEEIESERGVIQEEWRMSLGASERMSNEMLQTIFSGSKYAERLPIGTMDVVMHFKPETIKNFYKTWYRPDNMAVIAVGDFDAKEMEKQIIAQFGQIAKPSTPLNRPQEIIPDNEKTIVKVFTDPETPATMIEMFYKHPESKYITVGDYRTSLVSSLMSQMIMGRLSEKSLVENPPFVQAFAGYSSFMGGKDAYMGMAVLQNDKIENALHELCIENQRMVQHGFTATELERAKKDLSKEMEKQYNERDKQKSKQYISNYKDNFMPPHNAFPSIEYENDLFKKLISGITLEDVNTFAKSAITKDNCVIFIAAPLRDGFNVPTEDQILKAYNSAMNEQTEPYIDKVADKPLISGKMSKGKVSGKEVNKKLGYETWTLKNGIKVVIKPTTFKQDEIIMRATSDGGYSKLALKDVVSAKCAVDVLLESGLGNYDATELQKYLSGKNVRVTPYIGECSEGMSGSCGVSDFETMLELTHAYFTNPKFTESAFNSYMEKQKGMLANQELDPQSAWMDTLRWVMTSYSEYNKPMSADLLDDANLKRMAAIYKQRFNDPCNFTFYFIGNIDKKAAKPLIEKYLGSLETVERTETFSDLGIRPPKGAVEKEVRKGADSKCMEIIFFHGEMDYNAENITELDAVCKILTTKLLEEIREKESGVYTIGAYPVMNKIPYGNYMVQIFFSCDPDRETELKEKIFDVIKNMQRESITTTDIDKVIEKKKREHETEVKENGYWVRTIQELVKGDITEKDLEEEDSRISHISIKQMKEAAEKYFKLNTYVKVKLVAEK